VSSEKKKNLEYPFSRFPKERKSRFHLFPETMGHALIREEIEKR